MTIRKGTTRVSRIVFAFVSVYMVGIFKVCLPLFFVVLFWPFVVVLGLTVVLGLMVVGFDGG